MFFLLLGITFLTALVVAAIAARVFDKPIASILERIVDENLATAWAKYLKFAIYVVGVSGGVRIYQLERYITGGHNVNDPLVLTNERWVLEIYRTVIESLQAIAWMLLVFFIIALIAYVIVRIFESRGASRQT